MWWESLQCSDFVVPGVQKVKMLGLLLDRGTITPIKIRIHISGLIHDDFEKNENPGNSRACQRFA